VFSVVILVVGVLLSLMGIMGLCGAKKDISCCIISFKIMNYLLAIIFLILGVVSVFLIYGIGQEI